MKIRFLGIVCLVLTSLSGYAVLCVRHFYVTPSPTFVLSDRSQISSLSPECKKRLRTFFTTQRGSQQSSVHFSAELKKAFPALKKITFAYKNEKKTITTVQAVRPLFVFNNQVAITDQKTQVAQADFEQSILAQLPHFSVVQPEDSPSFSSECVQYACELDPLVHSFYDVEWVDSSLIKFHDKQHPQITVLGSVDTKAEKILQPACKQVVATLLERKPVKHSAFHNSGAVAKVNSDGGKIGKRSALHNYSPSLKLQSYEGWCIDRRFKGQIVVFPGGRVTNEKIVCG